MLDYQRKVAKTCHSLCSTDVERGNLWDTTEQHGIKFMVDSSLMREGTTETRFRTSYVLCVFLAQSRWPSPHTGIHNKREKSV